MQTITAFAAFIQFCIIMQYMCKFGSCIVRYIAIFNNFPDIHFAQGDYCFVFEGAIKQLFSFFAGLSYYKVFSLKLLKL